MALWESQLAYQVTAVELLLDLGGLRALSCEFQSSVSNQMSPELPSILSLICRRQLTSARWTDQDHADLLCGERAAELPGFEGLYARLETLELGVEALDFILDDTHGG